MVSFVTFAHRMKEGWDYTIKSKRTAWNFEFKALWKYRYLILLFFKRDFVANYKQTVLGPLWFVIQPILTTVIFTFVFGNLAGLAPEGVPDVLFFMSGIVIWNYFADVFVKTSTGFYNGTGANVDDVSLMKSVSGDLPVKASGGVYNRQDLDNMVRAGATRVGTSRAYDIYKGKEGDSSGY